MTNIEELNRLIMHSLLVIKNKEYNKFDKISRILDQGFFGDEQNVGLIGTQGSLNLSGYSDNDVNAIKIHIRLIYQYLLPTSITLDIAAKDFFNKIIANDRMLRAFKAAEFIASKDDKTLLPHLKIMYTLINICINNVNNDSTMPVDETIQWLQIAINKINTNDVEIDNLNIMLEKLIKDMADEKEKSHGYKQSSDTYRKNLNEMTFKYNNIEQQFKNLKQNRDKFAQANVINTPSAHVRLKSKI